MATTKKIDKGKRNFTKRPSKHSEIYADSGYNI